MDPLAEKYLGWSPYNYCLNNQLTNVDPTGMTIENNYEVGSEEWLAAEQAIRELRLTEEGERLYQLFTGKGKYAHIRIKIGVYKNIGLIVKRDHQGNYLGASRPLGEFVPNEENKAVTDELVSGTARLAVLDILSYEKRGLENATLGSVLGHELRHAEQWAENWERISKLLKNSYDPFDRKSPIEKPAFYTQDLIYNEMQQIKTSINATRSMLLYQIFKPLHSKK